MRGNDVIRLNDNNELTLGDIRKPGTDKCQCMLEAPIRTRTVPFTSQVSKNMLSLSGIYVAYRSLGHHSEFNH